MRESFENGHRQEGGAPDEGTPPENPAADEGAEPAAATRNDALEEARKAEHAERVRRISEARAAIEARRPSRELSEKDREEVLDLRSELEEIKEIEEAIRWNIENANLDSETERREHGRLQKLAEESAGVRRRIDAIKDGVPESQRPSVERRVGIGRETPPPPASPWWKKLFKKG